MNDYELWNLAQQRQEELLNEAENERLLREAGILRPKPLALKLLAAVCVAAPLVMLFVRVVAAAGGASLI
ncbi:MAG TPA: hypothetical protein VJ020_13355 [Anaerolineales bacterium]|nr:hypothetical protein [Anaerolineales bacterium]